MAEPIAPAPTVEYVENKLAAVDALLKELIEFGVNYGFQILGALIILIIGYLISRWIQNLTVRMMEKRSIDITTRTYIGKAVKMIVLFVALIVALGNFGVSISPMIAALGAITFGATLAMQGPISNYGAGLVIILTHPFRVGNTIEIQGVSGVVEEIHMACTILSTGDGERVTIPNQKIVGQILTNSESTRVAVTQIGIAYTDDPQAAVTVIESVLSSIEAISKETPCQVGIYEFGDSSINLQARYWVPTPQYYPLLHQVNMAIYKELIAAGISIPFPQREVRMLGAETSQR